MAEKLKIISLGGLNEVGKNLTVYEYGENIMIVDCGLGFPDGEMYGVDVVIPDVTYLNQNVDKIKGIVLTHGHEDHIGAVPYILKTVTAPIYATPLTAALVKMKLEEHQLEDIAEIREFGPGSKMKIGCFEVEAIHVNHSIACAVALAIKTPLGVVIHTGDYKIDTTPVGCEMTDLTRFGQYGREGVLALLSDSTNAERKGFSPSESTVGDALDSVFEGCDKRIIITTFASNVYRVQQIITVASRYGRKVAITGRSMENIVNASIELGYLQVPDNTLVDINKLKNYPKNEMCIITTGSQGETMSALYRMAFSGHKQVEIGSGDRVILSSSTVPGNEMTVNRIVNELFRRGAEVLYREAKPDLHVSGHGYQEEMKMILALTQPRFFIPVHGEQKHLRAHAELAKATGVPANNIVISDVGKVIELTKKTVKLNGSVPSGRVLVDGTGIGDVGSVVLRDRKHLAEDGMMVVVMSLSREDNSLISGPDIITRGFVYVKESEELIDDMRMMVMDTLDACENNNITDWATIKTTIKTSLTSYLRKTTKRTPMILPVIQEI
jgi:ribonuclease J